MRIKLKYLIMAALLAASLSSCKVWEEKWEEITPLPEIETPITPDPWEPEGEDNTIGN